MQPALHRFLPLILLVLLASCAEDEAMSPMPPDAAPADAGGSPSADAGLAPPLDAGRDGGPDAGVAGASCRFDQPLVHLDDDAVALRLGAFASSEQAAAIAWTEAGVPRLLVFSPQDGEVVADVEVKDLGALVPQGLDFSDGRYLLTGSNRDGTGSAFFDARGVQKASGSTPELRAMAVARVGEGGFVLAAGAAPTSASLPTVRGLWLGADAEITETVELGEAGRAEPHWDLAWNDEGRGVVCGSTLDASGEWVTLLSHGDGGSSFNKTAVKLAELPDGEPGAFGCRLALNSEIQVVAFSESEGASRLLWLGGDGATLAGPAPFLATPLAAGRFDVAVAGAATALAFFDDSSGAPSLAVRVYPAPGARPVEAFAAEGLALGGFVAERVRLERVGADFLVAFDAVLPTGRSHVVVRRLTCSF